MGAAVPPSAQAANPVHGMRRPPRPAMPCFVPRGADMPLTAAAAADRVQPQLLEATAAALTAAAAHLGVLVSGLPKELEAVAMGDGAAS